MAMPTVGRHVIAEQHDQIGIERVRPLDNVFQFLIVDERSASVNVRDDGDAQPVKLFRQIVDLDSFPMNDQPVGLIEKCPESQTGEAEKNNHAGNSDSLLPRWGNAGSSGPKRPAKFAQQKEK